MNKTLKVLLVLVVFAAALAVFTGVNADTIENLVANNVIANSTTVTTAGKTAYDASANVTTPIDLAVGENIELNLADNVEVTGKITVPAGATLTVNGTKTSKVGAIDNKGTVILKGVKDASGTGFEAGAIKNEGTATLENTKLVANLENYGTLTLKTDVTFDSNVKVVVMSLNSKVESESTLTSTDIDLSTTTAIEDGMGLYTGTKGSETKYFVMKKVTPTLSIEDATGAKVTTLTKGNTYTVVAEAEYNGYELTLTGATVTIAKISLDSTDGMTISGDDIIITDEKLNGVEYVITAKYDDKEYTIAVNGAVVPNPDDNNGDDNKGDDNNQGDVNQGDDNNQGTTNNGEENNNKGDEKDLDPDTPNTGDHIIPATALLAVVVVANVVYFAKMKRN